jgi:hypothetical protein
MPTDFCPRFVSFENEAKAGAINLAASSASLANHTTLRIVLSQCICICITTHVRSATSPFHTAKRVEKDCRCVLVERHTTVGEYFQDNFLFKNLTVSNLAADRTTRRCTGKHIRNPVTRGSTRVHCHPSMSLFNTFCSFSTHRSSRLRSWHC